MEEGDKTRPSHGTARLKMTLLSVSQRFLALSIFVKQDQTMTKSFIERILRKLSQMTTIKVVLIFAIFEAICAMVLLISLKRIELESCACAQIEAHEVGGYECGSQEQISSET